MEEVLIQKAVKTTIQILYDKGLFDNDESTMEVSKIFPFVVRHRPDLEEVNDVVQ